MILIVVNYTIGHLVSFEIEKMCLCLVIKFNYFAIFAIKLTFYQLLVIFHYIYYIKDVVGYLVYFLPN